MALDLAILYRGPLRSCDYGCEYCPFAKHAASREEIASDRSALERFTAWASTRPAADRLRVFFVPWGEALVHGWYQEAFAALTRLPQVTKVVAQTNLSGPVEWLARADAAKAALWATWHPDWADRARFLEQVSRVRALGARISVGVVGFRKWREEIAGLRRELPREVYLWINAVKNPWGPEREHPAEDYSQDDVRFFEAIDPQFPVNLVEHESLGHSCRTGASVVTVDGEGNVRRCPFVKVPIGNLYGSARSVEPAASGGDGAFLRSEAESCPLATCGCHIGYVHLDRLGLWRAYGDGILERIPANWPVS